MRGARLVIYVKLVCASLNFYFLSLPNIKKVIVEDPLIQTQEMINFLIRLKISGVNINTS